MERLQKTVFKEGWELCSGWSFIRGFTVTGLPRMDLQGLLRMDMKDWNHQGECV